MSADQTECHGRAQDVLLSRLPISHKPREVNATKQPPSPREKILPNAQALTGSSAPPQAPRAPGTPWVSAVSRAAASPCLCRGWRAASPAAWQSTAAEIIQHYVGQHWQLQKNYLPWNAGERERERGSCRLGWRGWMDRHRESVDIINPPDGHS